MSRIQVGHLPVTVSAPSCEVKANLVITANAYGVLGYVAPVAEAMSRRGYRSFHFPFSGQDGVPGVYSRESAVQDLCDVVDAAHEFDAAVPIHLLAHCAGTIAALEFLLLRPTPVERLAVYGLLFNPARRRAKAEERMARCGVQSALTEGDWNYPWLQKLLRLHLPIQYHHAHDALNLDRCTELELESAASVTPFGSVRWFDEGYDVRHASIDQFADSYASLFEEKKSIASSAERATEVY